MRSMSFFATQEQVRDKTKTVTRRKADTWKNLKVGEVLKAVNKCQGHKKGEHAEVLAYIRIVDIQKECLWSIIELPEEIGKEGFELDNFSPGEFINLFCELNGGNADQIVKRIEFEYLTDKEVEAL